jgi:hypothetical protein
MGVREHKVGILVRMNTNYLKYGNKIDKDIGRSQLDSFVMYQLILVIYFTN